MVYIKKDTEILIFQSFIVICLFKICFIVPKKVVFFPRDFSLVTVGIHKNIFSSLVEKYTVRPSAGGDS